MSKLPLTLLAVAALLAGSLPASGPAWAGGFHGKHYGYHGHHPVFKSHRHHRPQFHARHHWRPHYHKHRHRHHDDDDFLLGIGIIGGAAILGSVLAQPRVAPPPPVNYAPSYASPPRGRSAAHTSELQSLMRISYADFCLTH